MRRTVLPLVFALAALATFATSWAAADGNVNFVLASRHLQDDSWGKVQNQPALNVSVDFSPEQWPVHWVFGLGGSYRSENNDDDFHWFRSADHEGRIGEATFGLVFLPNRSSQTRPFIGFGVAKTFERLHERNVSDEDASDNSLGWYLNGGVYWRVGRNFNIGVDARVVGGTSGNLFGVDRSMNYKQIGLLMGFGF